MIARQAFRVADLEKRIAAMQPSVAYASGAKCDAIQVEWAVNKWREEVQNRPLQNVHRRTLDDTWRTVIRRFGGDPDELIGPSHDDLSALSKEASDDNA
jgi:hypothetical protein